MKQNDLFCTIKVNSIRQSDNTNTAFARNVLSPSKDIDIVSDDRMMNNDIIEITETQINPSDPSFKIIETLNFFNINFSNNKIKKI